MFLRAFAKLRKATISIVVRACPSVRMEHFGYLLEIWHFIIFENMQRRTEFINPLNAELNPICHLLALLGAHHILHVSRMRVNI